MRHRGKKLGQQQLKEWSEEKKNTTFIYKYSLFDAETNYRYWK